MRRMPDRARCRPLPEPTLRDKLTDQSARRCAQRAADRDLAFAAFRTDQQQARYIHAGDQQQQTGSAEQHQQYGTNVSNYHFSRVIPLAPWPRLESGYCFSSCRAIDVILANAV